ncbi:MAG: HAD hydrolase-like protein [Bacillus subtilis]|nr:HAD hydrolase-like protein [Bacillus subtilis]
MKPIKAVIFDLDGTLLDTIDDIADAMNRTLSLFGLKTYDVAAYKRFVGSGVDILVDRVLAGTAASAKTHDAVRRMYLKTYGEWSSRRDLPLSRHQGDARGLAWRRHPLLCPFQQAGSRYQRRDRALFSRRHLRLRGRPETRLSGQARSARRKRDHRRPRHRQGRDSLCRRYRDRHGDRQKRRPRIGRRALGASATSRSSVPAAPSTSSPDPKNCTPSSKGEPPHDPDRRTIIAYRPPRKDRRSSKPIPSTASAACLRTRKPSGASMRSRAARPPSRWRSSRETSRR